MRAPATGLLEHPRSTEKKVRKVRKKMNLRNEWQIWEMSGKKLNLFGGYILSAAQQSISVSENILEHYERHDHQVGYRDQPAAYPPHAKLSPMWTVPLPWTC